MEAAIIITRNRQEVIDLYNILNKPEMVDSMKGFWGDDIQDYNTNWYWLLEGNNLSGTSGYNSLNHSIDRFPNARIYSFPQFWRELVKNTSLILEAAKYGFWYANEVKHHGEIPEGNILQWLQSKNLNHIS